MQSVDVDHEEFSNRQGCEWMFQSNKVAIFGEEVDNDQNVVITM